MKPKSTPFNKQQKTLGPTPYNSGQSIIERQQAMMQSQRDKKAQEAATRATLLAEDTARTNLRNNLKVDLTNSNDVGIQAAVADDTLDPSSLGGSRKRKPGTSPSSQLGINV